MLITLPVSGQERSVRSRRTARAGAQTPSRAPKRMHCPISPLRKHHSSSPSPIFPNALLCFAFLPLCNVNLDHTPAHTTKSIKTYLTTTTHPLQSVIDHLPSIGKTQWGEVVCSLTAKHGFTKQMQAYLPQSPNPTQPRERRNASLPCITQHDVRQGPTTVYRLSEYQDFESRCRAD